MEIRQADISEVEILAKLWYDGWQDAHAQILPAELTRLRTLPSFHERLLASLSNVRVAGPQGAPVALCIVKEDELNQLYVSAGARGTGVAARLLQMERRESIQMVLSGRGWPVPLEMNGQRGSTKRMVGSGQATKLSIWKQLRGYFPLKCGGTRRR